MKFERVPYLPVIFHIISGSGFPQLKLPVMLLGWDGKLDGPSPHVAFRHSLGKRPVAKIYFRLKIGEIV